MYILIGVPLFPTYHLRSRKIQFQPTRHPLSANTALACPSFLILNINMAKSHQFQARRLLTWNQIWFDIKEHLINPDPALCIGRLYLIWMREVINKMIELRIIMINVKGNERVFNTTSSGHAVKLDLVPFALKGACVSSIYQIAFQCRFYTITQDFR